MKRLLVIVLLVLNVAHTSYAQTRKRPTGHAQTYVEEMLIALEKKTWDLYKNRDVKALDELTADDFYDIYPDGTVVNKKQWLKDMLGVQVKDSTLTDFKVIMLTKDAAIIVYTAVAHAVDKGKEVAIHNAVTSAWAKRNGRWVSVFYRENPIPETKS